MSHIITNVVKESFTKNLDLFKATKQLETLRGLVMDSKDEKVVQEYLKTEERYYALIGEIVDCGNQIVLTRTTGQSTWILVCDRKKENDEGYVFVDWPEIEDMQAEGIESMVGESIDIMPTLKADFSDPLDHLDFDTIKESLVNFEGGKKLLNRLREIKGLFDKIGNESSNNSKIQIIKENKTNPLFMKVMSFVYDDFVKTGMSFSTLTKYSEKDLPVNTDYQGDYSLESIMDYVEEHNTGALSTVQLVLDLGKALPDDLKEFVYRVFGKELKVGITAKSINKALGYPFIKQFAVQLAHPYHKYMDTIQGKRFVLTQKLDGHRAICIVEDNKAKFYTRKGLPINGLKVQEGEVIDLVKLGFGELSMVLDGELVLENKDNLATKDLFRATSRTLRSETTDKSKIIFNIFDVLPVQEFKDGESSATFVERKEDLKQAFDNLQRLSGEGIISETRHLQLVKNIYEGDDVREITRFQKSLVKPLGWEGLMLNLADGKYVTKRTKDLLKIKEFFDADVVVKDVFEGTGRLKNCLGGVVIDYKGYDIKVGSGFSLDEREEYWFNPNKIIGKVIQVNYFEETHNQNNDDISLRFPTFVCVRESKTAEDVSYEI